MGPKKKTTDNPEEEDNPSMMEMMRGMSAQLTAMNTKLEKIDTIESEVRSLRILLNDVTNENKQLKTEVKQLDQQLTEMNEKNNVLENRLNNLEQHHRGWSARVLGIPLTPEDESDNYAVAAKVYDLALLARRFLRRTNYWRSLTSSLARPVTLNQSLFASTTAT